MKSQEFKFRVWWKNQMRYNAIIGNGQAMFIPSATGEYKQINRAECETMQFTGLKDKNGVEIYGGDIIRVGDSGLGKIEWCVSDAAFKVFWISLVWINGRGDKGELIFSDHEITFEVAGNIHQNPELLS